MNHYLIVPGERDPRTAATSLLSALLETGLVGAVFAGRATRDGAMVQPGLITRTEELAGLDPFAPVSLVNGAALVSQLTARHPGRRLAALLRPCEIRALVELTKLRQASLEPVLVIGVDCRGTLEAEDYRAQVQAGGDEVLAGWREDLRAGRDPQNGEESAIRPACAVCDCGPSPHAALHLGLTGVEEGLLLSVNEQLLSQFSGTESAGEQVAATGQGQGEAAQVLGDGLHSLDPILASLGARPHEDLAGRNGLLSALKEGRAVERERLYADTRERFSDLERFAAEFATCRKCLNCRQACPICYCVECLFEMPDLKHEPEKYLRWAERKGALDLPADTALFHLTRLNHMSLSCVGCGQCTSACPSKLPVGMLFSALGEKARELFDYQPGRSLEEPLPLTVFKEDELEPRD